MKPISSFPATVLAAAVLSWAAVLSGSPQVGRAPAAACDRPCLADLMTRYLNAVVAHDPRSVPLAPGVRFTEDTVALTPGEGLWKTASRLRPYRVDFIDVREGVAATHTVIEEGASPSLVAVRLKVVDRRITEVETMVVRNASEGVLFNPANLQEPTPTMRFEPPLAQRNTREEMIRIASMYPAGLRAGSFVTVDVPFAPGAYRFENGMRMAGPGCTFQPPGCENMKAQGIPTLPEVTERLVAVDEEMGAVLFRLDFGRGSLPGAKYQGQAITTFEAFKVYGGQVHAAEAILEMMPVGAPSGWDK
jgi:hypothetical protein